MCHRYYIFHHEPPLESRATLWHWCLLIESANISIFLLSAPWQLNHNNQHHMSCVSLEKFCPFGSRISKLNFVLGRHWALVRCIALVRLHILCQKLFSLKHCLLPKKLLQWLDCKLTINFFYSLLNVKWFSQNKPSEKQDFPLYISLRAPYTMTDIRSPH